MAIRRNVIALQASTSASSASVASALAPQRGLLASFDPGPLATCFAPEVPQIGGAQPEVKWPAAPSLPTTSNCPASSRAMASTDSKGKPRQVPSENRSRLYDKSAPQTRMAGTDCRLKRRLSRKGIAAWKTFFFSYCRAASARWWPASLCCCGHCWACPDVLGESDSSPQGGNRYRAPFFEVTHTLK